MPNIPQYKNRIDGLDTRPIMRAADASADTARATVSTYNLLGRQVADAAGAIGGAVTDWQEERDRVKATEEISQGSAVGAALNATLAQEMNELVNTTDPNILPQKVQEFYANRVETALGDFTTKFSTKQGQEYATQITTRMRQHFFEVGAGATSTAKGSALRQNMVTLANQSSVAAREDPTSLNLQLHLIDTTTEGMISSNAKWLTPDQVAALRADAQRTRGEVVKAAGVGMAQINPDAALKDYTRGPFTTDVDADTVQQLSAYAEQVKRSNKSGADAAEEQRIKAEKRQFDQTMVKIEASVINPENGQVSVPPDYYRNLLNAATLPGADQNAIRSARDAAESIVKEQNTGALIQSDPSTYENFRSRLGVPFGAPNALTRSEVAQARASNHLSTSDYAFFSQNVAGEKDDPVRKEQQKQLDTFFTGLKSSITGSNSFGQQDPGGDQSFLAFQQDKQIQYWRGIAQGKTPMELLSPRSPDYIGRDVGGYQGSMKDQLERITGRLKGVYKPPSLPATLPTEPGAVPVQDNGRKPGESAADYLKRTGK